MLIINFEGREVKGLSKGRYDETFAGEDDITCEQSAPCSLEGIISRLATCRIETHCWQSHCVVSLSKTR